MKKLILFIVVVLGLLAVTILAQSEPKSIGSKTIESLSQGKVQLTIPKVGTEVDRVVLDNGLVLYFYEDHRLPLFNAQVIVKAGGIYDPNDKAGLSGLVGSVMRSGGTKTISSDSLNMLLEYSGASLETNIGMESGSAMLSVLAKDSDMGIKLLADLLRNPAFPQDKLDLAKTEVKNQIRRRNDDPGRLSTSYFNNMIYGDHPFGRILQWATVKGITQQDLIDYHQKYFVPNHMIIGFSGDFVKADLLAKVKAAFGDWAKSDSPMPEPPAVTVAYKPGVYQVVKDINQAYLNIGEIGIKRDNPDKFAVDLLNYILGGGSFTSRLTSHVRSDEGLAYHVGSNFDVNSRDYGTFVANCQTKSGTAYKATRLILDEIQNIVKTGVTEQELKDAQNSITNRLVFNFDSASKITRSLMQLEADGYPADYFEKYLDNYRKVTVADIKTVAQKYLKPDQLTFLVVGKPDTFEKPLSDFGAVTNVELTKPATE
jgi:zinc protease